MKQKRNLIIHPFLFAIYPVISLLAFNLDQTNFTQVIRVFFFVLGGTALLLLLLWLWLKDWAKAGLLFSIYLLILFGYPHIESYFRRASSLSPFVIRQLLLSITAVFIIMGSWWVWRFLKKDLSILTQFLNIMAIVALTLPIITVATTTVQNIKIKNQIISEKPIGKLTGEPGPDIYYIILDAYTRADIMQEVFDHDNSEFTEWLTEKGFYVAENAHSNYAYTPFSLSSSLNYQYLDEVAQKVGLDSSDRNHLTPLIHESKVRQFLENRGYTTVSFASSWPTTEIKSSDVYFGTDNRALNEFEYMLIQQTLPGVIFYDDLRLTVKREHVLSIFENLNEVPNTIESPKFVFAHIFAPHTPIAFGPNGEPLSSKDLDIQNSINNGYNNEAFLRAYSDEVTFINKKLQDTVTNILEKSDQPPIIIIQGDHGSRVHMDHNSVEKTCHRERMSILNAYYLPKNNGIHLYDSISPINSFPLIFNTYFETDLDLVADQSFFATHNRPYEFIDVTDQVDIPCQNIE